MLVRAVTDSLELRGTEREREVWRVVRQHALESRHLIYAAAVPNGCEIRILARENVECTKRRGAPLGGIRRPRQVLPHIVRDRRQELGRGCRVAESRDRSRRARTFYGKLPTDQCLV